MLGHMQRILVQGAPANFNWEEPAENKLASLNRGNNPLVAKHPETLVKTLAKEVRNSNLMPMARWTCTCSPYAHYVPQNILVKKGKKACLIWDGTTKMNASEITMNEMASMDNEAPATFGIVYLASITWMWNMRITYPHLKILLAFIDSSSCFRFLRIFADLLRAFGFVIGPLF